MMTNNNEAINTQTYKEVVSNDDQITALQQRQPLSLNIQSDNIQKYRQTLPIILLIAGISLIVVLIIFNVLRTENKHLQIVQPKKTQDQLIKNIQRNGINLTQYKEKLKLNKDVDRISIFPKYSKFNYNLAHYLLEKKDIDKLTCLNCTQTTLKYLKSTKFYDIMKIDNKTFKNDSFWIHLNTTNFYTSAKEVKTVVDFIKERDHQNLKGFSLFWSNKTFYMKSQTYIRDFLHQYISFKNFHYVETVSLGLRFMESGIIMIFEKQKPVYKPNNFSYHPKILGVQLTFKMNDNIQFMREWILYHIHIGFTKFFIFDNTWSIADRLTVAGKPGGANATHDKYQHPLNCSSNQTVWIAMFEQICEDFDQYLIYIPWQPYKNNRIQMQQMNASLSYINYYQDAIRWTFYPDFDQMLFSIRDVNLIDYVMGKEKQNFTVLVISQYKMISKFCLTNKLMIEGNLALKIDGFWWAPKHFTMNIATKQPKIHHTVVYFGNKTRTDPDDLRFQHYNLNAMLLDWGYEKKLAQNKQIYVDDLMRKRYAPLIRQLCQNKCSDTFKMICPYQTQATCPKQTKKTKK